MSKDCKLLIVDTTEAIREALTEALEDTFTLRVCRDGRTALEMLHRFRPHILVLELMLPGLDGLSVLQLAADAGIRPAVLATTRYLNEYVLESAHRLGVAYIMLRPCNFSALTERIYDIRHRLEPETSAASLPLQVKNLLIRLGIPLRHRGYLCLLEAILARRADPDAPVTKAIYPLVAKKYNISAASVEKNIRQLIHTAWDNRCPEVWQTYFPPDKRPSNDAFLSCIARCLPTDLELSASSQE